MQIRGKETIGRLIAMLYRMAGVYLGKELPALKISAGQYIFLAELFDEQGQSQEELTHRAYVDKANTARALSKLEEAGYVRRVPDGNDQRIKRAYLEPAALAIEDEFWQILIQWSDILTQDFSQKRKNQLRKDLNQMAENAASYLKRY